MYEQGQGVPRDDAQAAVWLRKAADQGYANAEVNLARFTNMAKACRRTTRRL